MTIAQNAENRNKTSWEAAKAAAKAPEPVAPAQPRMPEMAAAGVALLKLIDPAGWWNLVALDPAEQESPVGVTFPPQAWDRMAEFIGKWEGKRNIYFMLSEPKPDSPDKKLKKEDVAFIRGLTIDVDPEEGVPFDRARMDLDAEAAKAQKLTLAPSVTIDTGGGNQYFWLLTEKVDARNGGQERAEAQSRVRSTLARNARSCGSSTTSRLIRCLPTEASMSPQS